MLRALMRTEGMPSRVEAAVRGAATEARAASGTPSRSDGAVAQRRGRRRVAPAGVDAVDQSLERVARAHARCEVRARADELDGDRVQRDGGTRPA
jgi:hypothetical protein